MCLVEDKRVLKRAQIRINKIVPIFFGDYVQFSEVIGARQEIIKHRKAHESVEVQELAGVCVYFTQASKKKNKFLSHFELQETFLKFEEAQNYVFPNIAFINNLGELLNKVSRKAFSDYIASKEYE